VEASGVLLINKPAGKTSHDVVGVVRRLFNTRRVGHTGTLDPMATGVLVVLVGRAAKAAEFLTVHDKKYHARLKLGITTDTEDTTGSVLTTSTAIPTSERVLETVGSFVGTYMQTPPMYSALKVGGQKLVDLARRGIEIEREARPVTLHEIAAFPTPLPDEFDLFVHCSSGTYIRTLCADIGKALGCGGAMAALERTSVGEFDIADCHTLEALAEMDEVDRVQCLMPTEALFTPLPAVTLPAFFERLARSGCEIYQQKIHTDYPAGTRVRLLGENGFFAVAEVRDFENGSAIKAVKQFDI